MFAKIKNKKSRKKDENVDVTAEEVRINYGKPFLTINLNNFSQYLSMILHKTLRIMI